MAIPVVETNAISNQTSNATSKTDVTSPASVVNNDIVLIFIAIDGDNANPEANADGFATLTSISQGATELYVLWKRSTGGEPANYTVNWTGSEQARFMTVRVSGCITTGDPWDVISVGVSNASTTNNSVNRLTSTVVDTLAIYGCVVDRNRVDDGDDPSDTPPWTEVGTSGSSGSANGAGLIVAENDMPLIEQVEGTVFSLWTADQNVSRGFNLIGVTGGPQNFERTASQTLTHSEVIDRGGSTFSKTATTVLVHSEVIDRGASTFERVGTTVLVHSSVIARIKDAVRSVADALIHSETIDRGGSTFSKIATTVLVHSESIAQSKGQTRSPAQTITHSEAVTRQLGKLRTATTILVHSESIVRLLDQIRTAAQNLTHSSVEIREGSTFERTVAQAITESDVVVAVKGLVRTVTQTLAHSETIAQLGVYTRTAVQTITHSEIITRILENLRTATTVLVHSESVVAIKDDVTFLREASQNLLHSEVISQLSSYARTVAQNLLHSSVVSREVSGEVSVVKTPEFGGLRTPKRRIAALMSDGFNDVRIVVRLRERKREHLVRILNTIYYPWGLGAPVTIIKSIKKTFENKVRIIKSLEKVSSTNVAINLRSIFNAGENKAKVSIPIFNYGSRDLLIKKKVFDKGMKNVTIIRSETVEGSNIVKVKSLPEIIDEIDNEG